jgi:hypothetical protein
MKIEASPSVLQASLAVSPAMQPITSPQATQRQDMQQQPTQPTVAAVPHENQADQVSVNITVPRQTLDTIQKISSVTDFLNSTAKSLRDTGTALRQSSDIMGQMKSELGKIVKNFPPFPPESAERRDILMSYQAIREQIASMTIPPPPAPVYERVQHLWKELLPANKNSLDTPALSLNATDSQVHQADEQLTFTRVAVTQLRESIGASLQE